MNVKSFILIAVVGMLLVAVMPVDASSSEGSSFSEVNASYGGGKTTISGIIADGQSYDTLTFDICNPDGTFISTGYAIPMSDGSFSVSILTGTLQDGNGYMVKISASKIGAITQYQTVYFDVEPSKIISVTGVSLDQSTLDLSVGAYKTIVATVLPSDASNTGTSWKSSDDAVASVDQSGKIIAKSVGTAVITVTTSDGGHYATCNVNVHKDAIAATGVTLSVSSSTLDVGDSMTLSATVSPSNADNKDVTWSSSNISVATVGPSGKVTAVSAGTAVITVTTADGGYTATCTVTVNSAVSPSLALDKGSMTMLINDASALTATYQPSSLTVTWSSSDVSVATVDSDGTVRAVSEGTARITASCGGLTAACSVTVIGTSETPTVTASGSDGSYSVTIPSATVDTMADGSGLTVSTEIGYISISKDVLEYLSGLNGDLTISVEEIDHDELTDKQKAAVGDGMVVSFTATVGTTSVHDLNGTVTASIPYVLSSGEDPDNIKVYYLNDNGTIEEIECTYDASAGTVSFETDHFSYYAVTYEESAVEKDSSMLLVAIALVIIVAIIILGVYMMTKRRTA